MIDPKAIPTYAQYNEDIILLALLHDVTNGFYVDVGANYPVVDSVTKLFYDKGWRGINVEPLRNLYDQLVDDRPRDINLQIGLGDKDTQLTFMEDKSKPGHSTFVPTKSSTKSRTAKHTIQVRPLKDVLREHKVKHIHFLKVDVEGYELQVIAGNDWKKFRPEVICIEANHVTNNWRPLLEKQNYRLFVQDGLNEYYVAKESWRRTNDFAERIVKLDYRVLKQHQYESWSEDSKMLTKLHDLVQRQDDQNQALRVKVEELSERSQLSLKGRSLPARIARAGYGLTVDWIRYKIQKSKNDS